MRVQNVTPWVQVRNSMFFSMPVCRYPMPARASVTVSPSISSMSRSTPWVDGCCGPMLTTMRSSPRRAASSAISDQSPPAAGVVRVVRARDAEAQLEAQVLVVAQRAADRQDVLAGDVERELAAVHDHGRDRGVERCAGLLEDLGEDVDDLVEPASVGPVSYTH